MSEKTTMVDTDGGGLDGEGLASAAVLAEHLGVPEATLAQWRWSGVGPRYVKIGRHVRYRWSDVHRWLEANTHGSL